VAEQSPFEALYLSDSQGADSPQIAPRFERPSGDTAYRPLNGHVAIAALAWAGARRSAGRGLAENDGGEADSDRPSLSKAARLLRRLRRDFAAGSSHTPH
jgi:hypothetical protein